MGHSLFRRKSINVILKEAESGLDDGHGAGSLKKVLGVRDLTALGVAAVIGAGIFSSIGKAAAEGGPGVVFLYIFTAIACGFAALCYAEFASTVPVSGSAYTYSYVAFGEIFAWIIGWDLLMEYAIGNIAVAISWSDYFTNLMGKAGVKIPDWLTMDYVTAKAGATADAVSAWANAPQLFGFRLIMDIPALMIVVIITYIVFVGIRESRAMSNIMVGIKLAVIFLVIVVGAYYVRPDNWSPFTPTGFGGIMKGVSAVFFAYIGFDAISTTAEECKNPQRDLPRGMIYSLIICTILYVILALILTGMVHYSKLNVGDPLAMVFDERGLKIISGIVAASAIVATASVLLVFQIGQPRIWMSMSRDGLLPKIFSRIHPKYHTPSFSTILTGIVVAVPALFLNLDVVLALTSIGTLFAFVLVCGGVLVLQRQKDKPQSRFKVPYINGQYVFPLMIVIGIGIILYINPAANEKNISLYKADKNNDELMIINNTGYPLEMLSANVSWNNDKNIQENPGFFFVRRFSKNDTFILKDSSLISHADFNLENLKIQSSASDNDPVPITLRYFRNLFSATGFPMLIFWIVTIILTVYTFIKKFSLIPVLGLTSCFYLMAQESHTNWLRFIIWLVVGLFVYFLYGYKNSKLNKGNG